jgi:hypothetical protein
MASCVFIIIVVLWWGHIALSSYIACTSSQFSAWTAYLVFLLWIATCICPLCFGDLWNFLFIFIWFVVEIFENSKSINVLCGTSFGGFQ